MARARWAGKVVAESDDCVVGEAKPIFPADASSGNHETKRGTLDCRDGHSALLPPWICKKECAMKTRRGLSRAQDRGQRKSRGRVAFGKASARR